MASTTSAMPMGIAANSYDQPVDLTPPMPTGGMAPPPPAGLAAAAPPPPGAMPMGSTMPMMPEPDAPAAPPYTVRMQPDGSSIYVMPSPDGDPMNDIMLGRNEPPKLPKAFQPPAPQA